MASQANLSRLDRAQFSLEREFEFAEYLVELKRANRINKGNLKSEVFPTIVDKFAQKGYYFDLSQIKAKYYSLRSQTQEYNRMRFRVTGAGWDPILKTVTMDKSKWQAVIQENPSFKTYHQQDCRIFYMLSEVFNKMNAQGRYARDSNQPSVDINEEIKARQNQATNMGEEGSKHLDMSNDEEKPMQLIQKPDAKYSKGKGKRKMPESSSTRDHDLQLGQSRTYNNAIVWMDTKSVSTHSTSHSVDAPPPPIPISAPPSVNMEDDPYSVDKANDALDELDDLPDKVVVTAASILADSTAHRKTFLRQKTEARRRLYALKIGGGKLDN